MTRRCVLIVVSATSSSRATSRLHSADRPTAYATEVWHAVRRAGVDPVRVAAQHLPLTEWATVEVLQIQEERVGANARRV